MDDRTANMQQNCSFNSVESPCKCTDCYGQESAIDNLVSCNDDIQGYLVKHGISGIESTHGKPELSECDLILNRAGRFNLSSDEKEKLFICKHHRQHLSTHWHGCRKLTCSFPEHQGKKHTIKQARRVTQSLSEDIFSASGYVVPIGSVLCSVCKKKTTDIIHDKQASFEDTTQRRSTADTGNNAEYAMAPDISEEYLFQADTNEGIDESVWVDKELQQYTNRETLNQAMNNITCGRISPILSTLNSPWDTLKERQRYYYIRKARQVVNATLSTLAPGQETDLWEGVVKATQREGTSQEECIYTDKSIGNLVEAYNQAANWTTRRQILSLFVNDITKLELQKLIPGLTVWRIDEARAHAVSTGIGQPVEEKVIRRSHLDPLKADHFMEFISRPEYIQDVAYGTKKMRLDSGEELVIPGAIRTMIPARIIKQYESYCADTNFTPHSHQTLYNIINVCAASTQKSLQGLDYISTRGSDAFDDLGEVVNTLAANGASLPWSTETKYKLKTGKRYLKNDYKTHVQKIDQCADHCMQYSLSDIGNKQFTTECKDHDHSLRCDRCESIKEAIEEIATMITSKDVWLTEEQQKRLQYEHKLAAEDILSWKRHLLRTVNQEAAKQSALHLLDNQTIFIIMDWAMKFMPRKFREHMADFFGKRGINWHVSAIISAEDNDAYPVQCLVHIFDQCTQDWLAVASILENVLKTIKKENPSVTKVLLRSDNAGCYHNGSLIHELKHIGDRTGINITRYDFSDPQAGKDVCDRKIAPMKSQITAYVNEKHNVTTAEEMKTAIDSIGGVKGSRVAVGRINITTEKKETKWEGISYLSNFQYEEAGIRVWCAYGTGEGRVVAYKEPSGDGHVSTGLTMLNDFGKQMQGNISKSKPANRKNVGQLFSCNESGCIKSFESEETLAEHLDTGEHVLQVEQDSAYDKLKKQWAETLSGITYGVQALSLADKSKMDQCERHNVELESGWALKKPKKPSRMTTNVKNFLIDVFNTGHKTGRKANAKEISHIMKHKVDEQGKLVFHPDEWRSATQIASFFSRMSSAQRSRKLDEVTLEAVEAEVAIDANDCEALVKETEWQEMKEAVFDQLDYQHPLMFKDLNLCQLAETNGIGKLKLKCLKEICEYFSIEVAGPKTRKDTFVSPLLDFILLCRCT